MRDNGRGSTLSDEDLSELMQKHLEGQNFLVNLGDIPRDQPSWFDEKKFRAGQQFVYKYYGGVLFAHLLSLTLLIYSPHVLKPLIYTGKSDTPGKSYRRYIRTAVHVLSWYHGDIWKPGSTARKSLQQVRTYHSTGAVDFNSSQTCVRVNKVRAHNLVRLHQGQPLVDCIRRDLASVGECPFLHLLNDSYKTFDAPTSRPAPFFNQLDMSGTQFAFVGLVVLYPEKFGMKRATHQELEGFVHLWRCLGWMLGIDDRFNFCQLDNLADARRWTSYFVHTLVKPTLLISLTPEYEHIGRAVALGARYYLKGVSYESLYLYIGWTLDMPLQHTERRASERDRAVFRRLSFLLGTVGNWPYMNHLINSLISITVKIIVDPPRFWPKWLRPPTVHGLEEYWRNGE